MAGPGPVTIGHNLNASALEAPIIEMPMVEIEKVSLWYGEKMALKEISMSVPKHRVTAYIGPSGRSPRCFGA
jgi:ABC-type transport system involved in cytochrome bd biosynthesis fused ATPase/permease subunit